MVDKLNEDLQRVVAWCSLNSLLIYPDKTKLLIFRTLYMLKQKPANFHISLLGKNIYPVTLATDLGITLDSGLKYGEHISKLASFCMASLCLINRANYIFDKETLAHIVNALVFSKFTTARLCGQIHRRKTLQIATGSELCCTHSAREKEI